MISKAALLVPRLGTLDLRHLNHGVPGELGQRFLAGRLALFLGGNDDAALARGTTDLPPGKAGLAFQMLAAIDAGELEVRFHNVCPVLTQNRARITPNLLLEDCDPGREDRRPACRPHMSPRRRALSAAGYPAKPAQFSAASSERIS